jgi:hypothetical protein
MRAQRRTRHGIGALAALVLACCNVAYANVPRPDKVGLDRFRTLDSDEIVVVATVNHVSLPRSLPTPLLRPSLGSAPPEFDMRLDLSIESVLAGQLGPNEEIGSSSPFLPFGTLWERSSIEGRYTVQAGDRALLVLKRRPPQSLPERHATAGALWVVFERFIGPAPLIDAAVLHTKRAVAGIDEAAELSTDMSFDQVMNTLHTELVATDHTLGDVRRALAQRHVQQ